MPPSQNQHCTWTESRMRPSDTKRQAAQRLGRRKDTKVQDLCWHKLPSLNTIRHKDRFCFGPRNWTCCSVNADLPSTGVQRSALPMLQMSRTRRTQGTDTATGILGKGLQQTLLNWDPEALQATPWPPPQSRRSTSGRVYCAYGHARGIPMAPKEPSAWKPQPNRPVQSQAKHW